MKLTKYLLVATAALMATGAWAQSESKPETVGEMIKKRFSARGYYSILFDNREYKSEFAWSQTIFYHRAEAYLSFKINDKDRVTGGVDALQHFGRRHQWGTLGQPDRQPKPVGALYYEHSGARFTAKAGIFPRYFKVQAPQEIYDRLRYGYDPMMQGLLLRYENRYNGFVEFAGDWYSAYGDTQREKIMLYSSAQLRPVLGWGRFYAGYHASLQHYSESRQAEGVVDNAVLKPYAEFAPMRRYGSDAIIVGASAGWLQTFQRDRLFSGKVLTPGGPWFRISAHWRGLSAINDLYLVDNLMPLWEKYGTDLYIGDPWFRTTHGVYNCFMFVWEPHLGRNVDLRLLSVHHFDGARWGWQQMASLIVNLNSWR